jgi:hypothetical protein
VTDLIPVTGEELNGSHFLAKFNLSYPKLEALFGPPHLTGEEIEKVLGDGCSNISLLD